MFKIISLITLKNFILNSQIIDDAIDLGLDLPEMPPTKSKTKDLNVILSEDPNEYYNIHGLVGDDSCKHYTEQERIIMLL